MGFGQYSSKDKPSKPMFPSSDIPPKGQRAKHVFGSHDTGIEHVWANPGSGDNAGTGFYQTHGRNPGGNFYFKTESNGQRVIYSYRDSYPIGSLFTVKRGNKMQRVYLIRSGKPYSNTTASHMYATRRAVPTNAIRFEVSNVIPSGKFEHKQNVDSYITDITEAIANLNKSRSTHNINLYRYMAKNLILEVKRYAKFFNVRLPKLPTLPKLDTKAFKAAEKREKTLKDKRDAARQAKISEYEKLHAERVAEWESSGICSHTPRHSLFNKYACEQQRERDEWEANKAELIARWKRGENVTLRLSYYDYALLRVINTGKPLYGFNGEHIRGAGWQVETSQHVSVPVSGKLGAARLLRLLQALKADNRTYKRNGYMEHIGNFTVDSFGPNSEEFFQKEYSSLNIKPPEWVLIAGCHKILWSEIESVADQVFAAETAERGSNA